MTSVTSSNTTPDPAATQIARLEQHTNMTDGDDDKRRRRTPAEKAAILAEVVGAGGSVAAVAERHGISTATIYEWQRKSLGRAPAAPNRAVPSDSRIEIALGRVVMKVDVNVNPTALAAIVRALDAPNT